MACGRTVCSCSSAALLQDLLAKRARVQLAQINCSSDYYCLTPRCFDAQNLRLLACSVTAALDQAAATDGRPGLAVLIRAAVSPAVRVLVWINFLSNQALGG